MALGSTQPLTEMSTRCISWGKGGSCVRLQTYHHPVLLSWNLETLTSWNPLGHSRPVTGLLYLVTVNYVSLSWNLGTSTSWKPLGHSRPVTGLLYLVTVNYVSLSWNLVTSTSWNPLGHSRAVTGLLYIYYFIKHKNVHDKTILSVENPPSLRRDALASVCLTNILLTVLLLVLKTKATILGKDTHDLRNNPLQCCKGSPFFNIVDRVLFGAKHIVRTAGIFYEGPRYNPYFSYSLWSNSIE